MKDLLLLPLFLLLGILESTFAIYCAKSGYEVGSGASGWTYCFKAFQNKKNFNDAQRRCDQDGALLSKTDDDFTFVRKLINKQSPRANQGNIFDGYWIGGRRDSSDRFRWLDNSRVDYSGKNVHWVSGEPNDYHKHWYSTTGEDCLMTYNSWEAWNDCNCGIELRFICQMESIDPCENNSPCVNGGSCSSSGRNIICECPKGFTGDKCETDARPCTKNPCQNNGECSDVDPGKDAELTFNCKCSEQYEGERCEKIVDPCGKVTCQNGGTCIANGLKWTCNCLKLFTGSTCETSLKPCELLPCQNGAMCENIGSDYMCFCDPGYKGKNCEEEDACKKGGHPCQNGAECRDNDAKCVCPLGYSGESCEVGPCSGSPCLNGGDCADQNGDYFCECKQDFYGRNCQKECPKVTKDGFPEKLDIMFLVDGSGSVGTYNYKKSLEFVDKVINKVEVGKGKGRIGYVQFAGKWRRQNGKIVYYNQIKHETEITFTDSINMGKSRVRQAIQKDSLFTTYTRTGDALKYVLQRFQQNWRSNPEVAKYLFVLTDGKSTGQAEMVKIVSDEIFDAGITAFAIGVGSGVSTQELDFIAHGDRNRRFMVGDFNKLNNQFIETILEKQCFTGPCEKYEPCKNSGECIEYDNTYSCECPKNKFTGVHCEIDCKDVMIGGLPDVVDAVFLMDGSGSIDELDEFYNAKQLVNQVLMKMNIAETKQRAAVVQFAGRRDAAGNWQATYDDKAIHFNNSTEMGRLKVIDFVEKEEKWDGWTLTAGALEHVAQMITNEARPNVAKYLFVLTDGRVTRGLEELKAQAEHLKGLGVTSVAIAMGEDVDDTTLAVIANGNVDNIFKEANFQATAEKFIDKVVEKRCDVIKRR